MAVRRGDARACRLSPVRMAERVENRAGWRSKRVVNVIPRLASRSRLGVGRTSYARTAWCRPSQVVGEDERTLGLDTAAAGPQAE